MASFYKKIILHKFSFKSIKKLGAIKMKNLLILLSIVLIVTIIFFWRDNTKYAHVNSLLIEEPEVLAIPLGLPPIPWPKENPYEQKKAELGRLLYFDTRLSSDGTISCASCHGIPKGFADHKKVSEGIRGNQGTRNSPTVINAAYHKLLFWDGRAPSLEDQAKGPIGNPKEMTLADNVHDAHYQCEERVQGIPEYRLIFEEVYGDDDCSIDRIAMAIATFERTILSGNSKFDRYQAGDKSAMTKEEIAGFETFKRVGCANCHAGPNFSDGRFHNIGVGMDAAHPDLGRYEITKNDKDWGAFKTPILRDVANTYPYMHDGSLTTLEEVIDYYDKGGIPSRNLHPLMKPLHLTDVEKKNLVLFLEALNGEGWQHFTEPTVLPK